MNTHSSMYISQILIAVGIVTLCAGYATAVCTIRHRSMYTPQPLMVNNSLYPNVHSFIDVDSSGYAYLSAGENVTLICPGSYNYLTGGNIPTLQSAAAYCDGTNLIVDGRTISITSVQCYANPQVQVQINSVNQSWYCTTNEILIEVGFDLPETFVKLYDVCFNSVLQTPTSTRHTVVPGYRNSQSVKMSAYLFGNVDPVTAYDRSSQTASFTEQLDSASANKYITSSNSFTYKLLVPADDFVFAPAQTSTYFYFNSVPLWKLFQNGYWTTLESEIRKLSYTEGDLEVRVDVFGIAKLKDSLGTEKSVFLHSANQEKAIPIPAYLTKIVSNSQNEIVIFLQAQNKGEVSRSLQAEGLCAEDVCAQLRWLSWAQVPPAQRPVACCAADDALLRSRLPLLQQKMALRRESPRRAGLLVGRAGRHVDGAKATAA